MSTLVYIIIILVLTVLNGYFAMSEIALVSARKARLQQRADDGDKGAKTALELMKTPNRFLSTIQVGISLVGVLSGAFGGALLSKPLADLLAKIAWLEPYAAPIALIIVVAFITYLSLVIGELIPKRVALNEPEAIACRVAGFMHFMEIITRPVVNLLSASTDVGIKILGIKPSDEPIVTEDEIKVLMGQGAQVGVFHAAEEDMVSGIFKLGERRVDALMTPRTEVDWVDLDHPRDEIIQKILGSHFSRLPVARESLDNVMGILETKTLVGKDLWQGEFEIMHYAQKPLFVPESLPAIKTLDIFQNTGYHCALVIDEYGGVQGMVTLYDILEAIVGDIPEDLEDRDQQAVQREDGSWLFDGLILIDELKEILDIDLLPGEERGAFQTLSGFVMSQLGNIPVTGQSFFWENFRFEVVDMDGRRVDRVMVSKVGE